MKLKSLYLKNYAGIERASGRCEIYIDFTKCLHDIILIIGPNGGGKTTILDSLSPLPDNNSSIIGNREGEKRISYIDDDIVYDITIVHPIKLDGTRGTIKGYINKVYVDGTVEELNSNGNITSFKDKVYEVFGLDPNYISLMKLSMDDRGIVSKSPIERKKFVTGILESVEVYNNIYKTLSKRSSTFKSLINSAASKINAIGNEEELRNRLISIETRLKDLTIEKEKYNKALADNEASIKVMDPDGSIQDKYNNIVNQLNNLINKTKNSKLILSNNGYDNINDLIKDINTLESNISALEKQIDSIKQENQLMLNTISGDSETLTIKRMKLSSLNVDDNINILKNQIVLYQKENDNIKKNIPVDNIEINISVQEFVTRLDTLKSIIEEIKRIKEQSYDKSLKHVRDYMLASINIVDLINSTRNDIELAGEKIKDLKIARAECEKDIELVSILDNRPSTCKDDTCPFIKKSLDAKLRNPVEKLAQIDKDIYDSQMDQTIFSDNLQELNDELDIYNRVMIIFRTIDSNSRQFEDIGASFILNREKVLDYLVSYYNFDMDMDHVTERLEIVNQIALYKANLEKIESISNKLEVYKNKIDLIEELQNDINIISKKVNDYNSKIDNNNLIIKDKSSEYVSSSSKLNKLKDLLKIYQEYEDECNKIEELKSIYNTLSSNITAIQSYINNINNFSSSINNINVELEPLTKEKDNIAFSLKMLEQYKSELEVLNLKYDKVETVKKYSSPAKGIQTLYMELYMGKTLKIANELLAMLFDGDLELMDYIINETEFRIPVRSLSSNIINDDIKSCSSAQRSMISMIISLALSTQGSSKFNIIRLDEVDSPLDEINRSAFIPTLNNMMKLMHINQCVMISHSSESELSNVDIISLKNNYIGTGNIIFQY